MNIKTNEELFVEYQNEADKFKKEEILNTLFKQNIKFPHQIAKKFKSSKIPYDELVNLATVGMVKSIHTYNPQASKFTTYSSKLMVNEILIELRKSEYKKDYISIETPIGDGNIYIGDLIEDESVDLLGSVERKNIIDIIMIKSKEILNEKEYKIILNELSNNPKNQRDLCVSLGVSQSQISRLRKRAIGKIRKLL